MVANVFFFFCIFFFVTFKTKDLEQLEKYVAKSLSNVISYSTNQVVREACLKSLNVTSCHEIEEKIKGHLTEITEELPMKTKHENMILPKKKETPKNEMVFIDVNVQKVTFFLDAINYLFSQKF